MRYAIIMFIALGFIVPLSAQQLHIYKTPDGRTVIGNTPPPADAKEVKSRKQTDPANRSTPPPPIEIVEPPPPESPPQTIIVKQEPEPKVQSKPVDTRELALIRPGMSQSEVRRRLGEPEDVIPLGERSVLYRTYGGGLGKSTATRERWIYPGSFKYDPASVTFENGRVVATGRER